MDVSQLDYYLPLDGAREYYVVITPAFAYGRGPRRLRPGVIRMVAFHRLGEAREVAERVKPRPRLVDHELPRLFPKSGAPKFGSNSEDRYLKTAEELCRLLKEAGPAGRRIVELALELGQRALDVC